MANVVITLLPVTIVDIGDEISVFGEARFDGGNYATGGVQAAWDYASTPNANLAGFKKVSTVHATRPPIESVIESGDGSHAMYAVQVATSPLPKIAVTKSSDGTEMTNGVGLGASITSPTEPHTFSFKYKKNL